MFTANAHRSNPESSEHPCPILVWLHYYTEKEQILDISEGKGWLSYWNSAVLIFLNLLAKVGILQSAFNPVKLKLHEAKIFYRLFFPAVLFVNFNVVRQKSNTQESSEEFQQTKIAQHPLFDSLVSIIMSFLSDLRVLIYCQTLCYHYVWLLWPTVTKVTSLWNRHPFCYSLWQIKPFQVKTWLLFFSFLEALYYKTFCFNF